MTYLTLDGEIERINLKGIYPLARRLNSRNEEWRYDLSTYSKVLSIVKQNSSNLRKQVNNVFSM